MPRIRGKLNRQNLPPGQDGQVLVLETHTPNGIAWRSGVDRVVTDIAPELSGALDCNTYDLTNAGDVTFAAVTNEVAGIQNQNLLDKSETETVSGAWTFGTPLATASLAADSVTKLLYNNVSAAVQYAGTIPIEMAGVLVNESPSGFDTELTWTGQVYKYGVSYASNLFAPSFRIDRYRNVGVLAGGISVSGTTGNFVTGPSSSYLEVDDVIGFASAYLQHTYHTVTIVGGTSEFTFSPAASVVVPTGGPIRKIDSTLLNVRGVPFGLVDVKNEFSFSVQDESVPETIFYYRFMLSHDGNNIFQGTRSDIGARASVKLVKR